MTIERKYPARWWEEAKAENATHLIVVCDTFDYEDYPVAVLPHEDVNECEEYYHSLPMQRVMEVFTL